MIYKDNIPYKLTAEEVKKYGGKKNFRIARNLAKWDATDGRIRRPNAVFIEPFYTLFDKAEGSTQEIRYVKSSRPKTEAGVTFQSYTPSQVEFPTTGRITVENDSEYCYFLSNHPANEDSPNRNEKIPVLFFIENKPKQADALVKKKQALFDAQTLLFSMDKRLPEKDLRGIALSYPDLVGSVDEWSTAEVIAALDMKVQADPLAFMKLVRSERTQIKYLISAAVQHKLMRFSQPKGGWFTLEDGEDKEMIVKIVKGKDPQETLIDHLLMDDTKKYSEYFERTIKEIKSKAKQTVEEVA